jgi:hypothetical protein
MRTLVQEQRGTTWGATFLSDPKRLAGLPDGSVAIQEHLPPGIARRSLIAADAPPVMAWISHGGTWRQGDDGVIHAPDGGDAFLIDTLWGADLAWEAELWLGATGSGSLVLRSNPSALAGYRVALDAAAGTLTLYLCFPGAPDQSLQQRAVALQRASWQLLRVVARGPCLEVYLDDALWIVHADSTYASGCFGLHGRGAVRFRSLRADTAAPPDADWQQRCEPRHLRGA